jgi:hypothetical protein
MDKQNLNPETPPQPVPDPAAQAAPGAGETPAPGPAAQAIVVAPAGDGETAPADRHATPDGHGHGPGQPPHSERRSCLGSLFHAGVRFYTFLLLLLVIYPAYLAGDYVVRTVFVPMPVPRQFLDWQASIDVDALRSTNVPGVTGPAARAPLGHYHRIERWFQPDPRNGCTPSGCHAPLPHSKKMKVPAFANFHTTFMACQMCHTQVHDSAVAWVSTETGRTTEVPPLLKLLGFLETPDSEIKANPAAAHTTIVALLRATLAICGDDPALRDLLLQFETSDPGSPVWRVALDRAGREIPLHARGEYGAKLAPESKAGDYAAAGAQLTALARQQAKSPEQQKPVYKQIHDPLLKEPVTCVSCHGQKPPVLNFEKLGYPPMRARLLANLQLARLMQQIREGEEFHLPRFLESGK